MARKIGLQGDRVLRLRERLGYTQMEAAYKCNMNQGNFSQIERGQRTNVTMETLVGLAEGLQTSVEYLIGATNDPAPNRQSALDRLTDDEARWLVLYRELMPVTRESLLGFVQKLADRDRALADSALLPTAHEEPQ